MAVFLTRALPVKTKEAKKATFIANRITKTRKQMMKPSACTVKTYGVKNV